MSNFYDDSRFGVITRKWFGLTKKWGGETATGFTIYTATHGATTISHVAKWYPRGPIKMVKAGAFVMGTVAHVSGSHPQINGRIRTRGASASSGCTFVAVADATAIQAAIGSTTTFSVRQCKAGEYITVQTSTPTTAKGTRVLSTVTGTVAFFVDYIPTWDSTGKWDTP